MIEKSAIEVNETAANSAAADRVRTRDSGARGAADATDFIADRPFVFAVRDATSGCVLFLGRVEKPT